MATPQQGVKRKRGAGRVEPSTSSRGSSTRAAAAKQVPIDIVRCICSATSDDGTAMIQCDNCTIWQHIECVLGPKPHVSPPVYHCELCAPRPKDQLAAQVAAARARRGIDIHLVSTDEYFPLTTDDIDSSVSLVDDSLEGLGAPLVAFPSLPGPDVCAVTRVHVPGRSMYDMPVYCFVTQRQFRAGEPITRFVSCVQDASGYLANPKNQYASLKMPKQYVHLLPIRSPLSSRQGVLLLDSRGSGNTARFARSGCRPNAELALVRAGNSNVFALVATRDISLREEVVLPWEWDDSHLVHDLPNVEPQSAQTFLAAAAQGNIAQCVCPPNTADCVWVTLRRLAASEAASGAGFELLSAKRGIRSVALAHGSGAALVSDSGPADAYDLERASSVIGYATYEDTDTDRPGHHMSYLMDDERPGRTTKASAVARSSSFSKSAAGWGARITDTAAATPVTSPTRRAQPPPDTKPNASSEPLTASPASKASLANIWEQPLNDMLDDLPVGNPFASFAAAATASAAGASQTKQQTPPVPAPAASPAPAPVTGPSAAWHNVPVPDDEKHLPFALRKQWRRAAFDKIHGEGAYNRARQPLVSLPIAAFITRPSAAPAPEHRRPTVEVIQLAVRTRDPTPPAVIQERDMQLEPELELPPMSPAFPSPPQENTVLPLEADRSGTPPPRDLRVGLGLGHPSLPPSLADTMDVDRSLSQPPDLQIDISAAQAEMAAALVESPRVTKRIGMGDYLKRRQARLDAGEDSVSPTTERRDELRSQSPAVVPEPISTVVAPTSNDPPIPGLDLVGPDQDRDRDRDVQMVDMVEPGELVQDDRLNRATIIQIKTEVQDGMEQVFGDGMSQAGRSASVVSRRRSPSSGSGEHSANGAPRLTRPYNGPGRFNNGYHYNPNYRGRGTWNQRGRRMTNDGRNWQSREDGDRRISGNRENFMPSERTFPGSSSWAGQRTNTPPPVDKPKPQPWLAPEHSPQNRNQVAARRHSLSQQPQPPPQQQQQQEWPESTRSRDLSPPLSDGRIISDRGWATVIGGQNDPLANRPVGQRGISPPPLIRGRMESNDLRPPNGSGFGSSPPRGRYDDGPARYDDSASRAYSPPPPRAPPSATGRFNDRFEERGYEERTSQYEYDRHESPMPGPGGYGAPPRTAPYDDRRIPMSDSFEREYDRGRMSAGPAGYGETAFERDRFEPSQGSYSGRDLPQRNTTGAFDVRDRAPPTPAQTQFRDQRDRAPSYNFQDRGPNGSYREEPGEVYERGPPGPKWAPRPRTPPIENNYRPGAPEDIRGPPVQNGFRAGNGDGFRGRGADGGGSAGGFRERTENNYRPMENNYRPMEYQQQQQSQQQRGGPGEFQARTPPPPPSQSNW